MPNLYIIEPGALLEKEGGWLLVTKTDEVLFAAPATRVDQVVIVGGVGVTTPALGCLLDRGIGLVFLSAGGQFRGRLSADLAKNVGLRRQQYRRLDDDAFRLRLGRALLEGKLRNSRTLCLRLDQSNDDPLVAEVAADLLASVAALATAPDLDALMGIEGRAAKRFFAVLRHFLRPPWTFERRARRPPPDPVNALLSLLYTLLHESCVAALEAVGLDPACGYLHGPHYGRASLALDLMEEFRPVIADSVALLLLNKRLVAPDDFVPAPAGKGLHLNRDGWRQVAEQYGRRMRTQVKPPGLERRITYQKLLEVQARRMRRVIEGEDDTYEPFLTK